MMPLVAIMVAVTIIALILGALSLVPNWAWIAALVVVAGSLVLSAFVNLGERMSNWFDRRELTESSHRALLHYAGLPAPPLWKPRWLWGSKDLERVNRVRSQNR